MKKIVVLSGGLVAAGSAALVGAGVALSQPGPDMSSYNVVGEQYSKALQILKSQGVKAYFGGSFGSVLPQAQCLVDQQKITSGGRMLLMLDCSQKAADMIADMGPSGGSHRRLQRHHHGDPDPGGADSGRARRGCPGSRLGLDHPFQVLQRLGSCCGRPDARQPDRRSGRAGCLPIRTPAGR